MPLRMTKFIRDVGVDRVIVDVGWVHSCGTCRRIRTHGDSQTSNVYGRECLYTNRGKRSAANVHIECFHSVQVKLNILHNYCTAVLLYL